MIGFSIKAETRRFKKLLRGLEKRFLNFRPVLKQSVYPALLDEIRTNFRTEGGLVRGGWQPLSPVTVAEKARLGFPAAALVRTGDLLESLTNPSHPDHVATITKNKVTISASSGKYRGHDKGFPPTNLPARQMVPDKIRNIALIRESISRYLHG